MKRLALLLAVLLLVGCSSKTKAPPQQVDEPPKETQIVVSEEAAVKAATNADPRASVEGWAAWKVQLDKDVELEVDGKTQKHTVWVVEASHSDGENLVIYVTATVYPPKVLKVDISKSPSGDLGRLNDQQKHLLDRLVSYSLDAEGLWSKFQDGREPSKNDFATLSSATGIIWRDSGPSPLTLGKDRVERAIRLLSTTIQLGEGTPPSKDQVDYEVEFTGLTPSISLVLSKNAAYFQGKVYYRPGLADWFGTNMHAN
jgi:hypothetical protein